MHGLCRLRFSMCDHVYVRPTHLLVAKVLCAETPLARSASRHPLDLTKVQMQTAKANDKNTIQFVRAIVAHHGIRGVYDGLTAAMLRA